MPWTSDHIRWLIDTGKRLATVDGKTVEVWEFSHKTDDTVLVALINGEQLVALLVENEDIKRKHP